MPKDEVDPQRLVEIETKIAYQEKTIADLNDAIVDLNRTIIEYARRLNAVERVIRTEFERRELPNERPPHY